MHNLSVNQRRKGWREQVTEDGILPEFPVSASQMDGLALEDLSPCLYRLPEEQRAVLLLVCVEELSYAQCAQVLAIPVGTVMSRLTRARQKLARLLVGDEEVVVKLEVVK